MKPVPGYVVGLRRWRGHSAPADGRRTARRGARPAHRAAATGSPGRAPESNVGSAITGCGSLRQLHRQRYRRRQVQLTSVIFQVSSGIKVQRDRCAAGRWERGAEARPPARRAVPSGLPLRHRSSLRPYVFVRRLDDEVTARCGSGAARGGAARRPRTGPGYAARVPGRSRRSQQAAGGLLVGRRLVFADTAVFVSSVAGVCAVAGVATTVRGVIDRDDRLWRRRSGRQCRYHHQQRQQQHQRGQGLGVPCPACSTSRHLDRRRGRWCSMRGAHAIHAGRQARAPSVRHLRSWSVWGRLEIDEVRLDRIERDTP